MATQLGNMAVGSIVYLNENSSPVPYIIVHQGLPSSLYDSSCNGTWLLRQNIYASAVWNSTANNTFTSATINTTYLPNLLNLYDSDIQLVIKTVKIPYCMGTMGSTVNKGENGYSCRIFLLGAYEVGLIGVDGTIPADGALLSYFISGVGSSANSKRIAYLSSAAASWWLRLTRPDGMNVWYIQTTGSTSYQQANLSNGVRPAMIMPTDLIVDDSGNVTGSTVPNPPASITVPTASVPAGSSIAVSWPAVSGVTSYTLQRSVNGGSWQTVQTSSATSFSDVAQATWTQVQYQVCSTAYGFNSAFVSSSIVTILPYTITSFTVPSLIMEGQDIPLSWSPVDTATSYILQRNADSGGWTQIYSGANTSYTDTLGDWTSVQYRVQAGANNVYGAFFTSASIPIISASALVISGTDGDLGTITADIPYTVSSDTGNAITLARSVNGIQVASLTVQSGFAYTIPVMDLPTGSGTIEISASVQTSSGGPVSATRTWTYTKTAITFPNAGGVAPLTLNGQNVFPESIAEAVRTPGIWGGNLGLALQKLAQAMLFDPDSGAVEDILGNAIPMVSIETGSYVGTGTAGASHPNVFTFNGQPRLVFLWKDGTYFASSQNSGTRGSYDTDTIVPFVYGGSEFSILTTHKTSGGSSNQYPIAYSISGNTLTWYQDANDNYLSGGRQYNQTGITYKLLAICIAGGAD